MSEAKSSSLSVVPDEHDQMYDRQTRIWGGHGQKAIETANICVLGAGPTSSETLKNLVLPNVGHFTLVDDKKVTQDDLGNNFFVEPADVGSSRAAVVTKLLLEMNESVEGKADERSPVDVINNNIDFFQSFQLVIASQLAEEATLKLGAYLYQRSIPFLVLQSYGFLGTVRLAVPELHVVETHYENDRYDLFVHPDQMANFPELQEYCDSFPAFDTLDGPDVSHVPYIVILQRLGAQWRAQHGGALPKTFDEKKEFKQLIIHSARDFGKNANFGEAEQFAHRVYNRPQPDDDVQAVLDHPSAAELSSSSANFWVLARAVKDFMAAEGKGSLPASADIPDMTCKTDFYVRLQNLFRTRADRDLQCVKAHVARLAEAAGCAAVPDAEVAYFVKNVRGIKAIAIRSLAQEHDPATPPNATNMLADDYNEIFEDYEDPPEDPDTLRPKAVYWYFALRAANRFHRAHGRYPGTGTFTSLEDETKTLTEIQEAIFKEYGINSKIIPEVLQEIVRFGAAEVHNTAAFLGGVGAQVALKTLLRQFIPVNNTVVYDGIFARQKALEL